jgi:hypothetical protein
LCNEEASLSLDKTGILSNVAGVVKVAQIFHLTRQCIAIIIVGIVQCIICI